MLFTGAASGASAVGLPASDTAPGTGRARYDATAITPGATFTGPVVTGAAGLASFAATASFSAGSYPGTATATFGGVTRTRAFGLVNRAGTAVSLALVGGANQTRGCSPPSGSR